MKDVWYVRTNMMNGTITLGTVIDVFATKELAEEAADKLREVNKDSEFAVNVFVGSSKLYEDRDEIPLFKTV